MNHNFLLVFIFSFLNIRREFCSLDLYVEPKFTTDYDCPTVHRSCSTHSNTGKPDTKSMILTCSCSPSCPQDGDCCLDAPLPMVYPQHLPVGRSQCITPRGYNSHSYYMISKCPLWWTDLAVRDLCSLEKYEETDEMQKVPVSSFKSNATYRNLYCAVCNGEIEKLVSWNVEIGCKKGRIPKFLKELLRQCSPQDSLPLQLKELGIGHICDPNVISKCSSADLKTRQLCHQYYAPVRTKNGKIYKNKFCAFCNNENYEDLRCTDVRLKPLLKIGYSGIFQTSSFTKLIFGFGVTTEDNLKCGPGYIYVKWSRQDRPDLSDEGRCVWTGHSNNQTRTVDCPGEIQIHNKYSVDINGNVLLYETNVTIPSHAYEMLPNASISICIENQDIHFQGLLFVICSSISLITLSLKVVFHFCIPEPKTLSSMSIVALSVALFFAQVSLLLAVDQISNFSLCIVVACIIHYFLLASFCWTNVLAFLIYKQFSLFSYSIKSARTIKKRFIKLNIYSWVLPLVFVSTSLVFDRFSAIDVIKPGYGKGLCWFTNNKALLLFFGAPLAVILGTNIFFFVVTSVKIFRTSKEVETIRKHSCGRADIVRFRLYIKLALIMGMTWVLAFIAASINSDVIWVIFDVLQALQGTFIFLAFTDFQLRSKITTFRDSWLRTRQTTNQTDQTTPLKEDTSKKKASSLTSSRSDDNFAKCIDDKNISNDCN